MAVKLVDVILALLVVGLAEGTFALLVNGSTSRCHPYITIKEVIYR